MNFIRDPKCPKCGGLLNGSAALLELAEEFEREQKAQLHISRNAADLTYHHGRADAMELAAECLRELLKRVEVPQPAQSAAMSNWIKCPGRAKWSRVFEGVLPDDSTIQCSILRFDGTFNLIFWQTSPDGASSSEGQIMGRYSRLKEAKDAAEHALVRMGHDCGADGCDEDRDDDHDPDGSVEPWDLNSI